MSFDVLHEIKAAEETAQQQKDAFLAEMKVRQAEIDAEGRALLEDARSRAGENRKLCQQQARQQAAVYADQVAKQLEADGAALRAAAESRLESAADYIVERIVNG